MGQPSSGIERIGVSTRASRSSPPWPPRRGRWPNWSRPRRCPARPRTGWPSRSRCTACSPATPRAASCSARASASWPRPCPIPLVAAAGPVLAWVRDECGESAQLYRRDGAERVCVAAAERAHGLRTTVPVGTPAAADRRLRGAGALRVVRPGLARRRARRGRVHRAQRSPRCAGAAGRSRWRSARPAWPRCRRRCSPPAARCSPRSRSPGPIERLGRSPGSRFAPVLVAGARRITAALAA